VIELAFDTATAACSVALRVDGELFESRPPAERLLERPAHTTELLPEIESLITRADIQLADVTHIAVGVGPGAFTGLRIGVATARAIATANGVGLTGVSSLAALAAGVGEVTPVIDARRKEFFFRIDGEDLLAGPEEAVAAIAAAGLPAIGDGAIGLIEQLSAAGVEVPASDAQHHVVSAAAMLDLARESTPAAPDEIVPNYIRPPDAKVSSRESWMVGAK
jgi:tRNA threonylcarbamoyladenosine biosynthesis protein TsaB